MSELIHLLPTPYAAAIFDRLTRQAKAVSTTGDPRIRDHLRSDLATDMVIAADTYRPSASLRRYLAARDQHCRFPTCNRNTRWCDIDHTVAWENGGKTVPENLAHLCRGHHTLKHHSQWKVRQISPGILEWTTPHGDIVTGAEPPRPRFKHEDSPPPF